MIEQLTCHLASWLGTWPPERPFVLTTAPGRTEPGWDGRVREVVGVRSPAGTVLSVPPRALPVLDGVSDLDAASRTLARVLDKPGGRVFTGVFRWSEQATDADVLPDTGSWVPVTDPRVPEWLHPFGGEVLLALDHEGRYAAGVGLKRHDEHARELSVVTEEAHRGRGLAARLVAQAARAVLAGGRVPTYLHATDNVGSARTADKAGFPDRGWQIIGFGD